MKIYTKTGDKGTTGLIGGSRVSKSSDRIMALGVIDELNAQLGRCRYESKGTELDSYLFRIQNQLFQIGAQVATPQGSPHFKIGITAEEIETLESEMDAFTDRLPPLKNFILPGGCALAAELHIARSTCRRAERELIRLQESLDECAEPLKFLNRLSDWLFVAARIANLLAGVEDVVWKSH